MGETNKHKDKCKTACLLNPVIAQESSVRIEKAKGKEQLQGEMAETTLTKERLSDDNYICPKERTYPMEQIPRVLQKRQTSSKDLLLRFLKG